MKHINTYGQNTDPVTKEPVGDPVLTSTSAYYTYSDGSVKKITTDAQGNQTVTYLTPEQAKAAQAAEDAAVNQNTSGQSSDNGGNAGGSDGTDSSADPGPTQNSPDGTPTDGGPPASGSGDGLYNGDLEL